MTSQLINVSPNLFIDIEGAYITYSEVTKQLNQNSIKRSSLPFSEMKHGKFRKLFNRHTLAYKH